MTYGTGYARFIGVLCLAIVGLGTPVAAMTNLPAYALGVQGAAGPYFLKMEQGLYYPAYLERDSAAIAMELGLAEDERALVEALIDNYVTQFEAEKIQVEQAIQASKGGSRNEMPDIQDRKVIRKRAKAAMQSGGNPARLGAPKVNAEVRIARVMDIIREEIDRNRGEPLPNSSRTLVIHDWSIRKQELQDELLEKFELVKGVDPSHWNAVNRALRRINTAWPETFRGEEADLDLMLMTHFGSQSMQYKALWQDRLQYAIEFDELLSHRNDLLASTTPTMLDARDRTDLGTALSLGEQQVNARAALVDLNLEWLARFAEKIDNEQEREAFVRYAQATIFPDLHRGDPPIRTIDYIIEKGLADAQLIETLEEARREYQARRSVWRTVAIGLMPTFERERLLNELEINIVHLAYRGWINGLGTQRDSPRKFKEHLAAGVAMDTEFLVYIRTIIGVEAYQQIPGQFKTPRRGDMSRGPVPNASNRSLNVVYWDEMMRSQQKN